MKKGYSQYDEDEFVLNYFNNKIGFLVDIGAADGVTGSNSKFLIENGWSGLLIEPNKKHILKLKKIYENYNNILLENIGCSYETNDDVDFFIDQVDGFELASTFNIEQMNKVKNIHKTNFYTNKVNIVKTSDIFKKYNINKIDFLSIDTESYDENVLKGIDFGKCSIDLICIETVTIGIKNLLDENGYKEVYKTPSNHLFSKI